MNDDVRRVRNDAQSAKSEASDDDMDWATRFSSLDPRVETESSKPCNAEKRFGERIEMPFSAGLSILNCSCEDSLSQRDRAPYRRDSDPHDDISRIPPYSRSEHDGCSERRRNADWRSVEMSASLH